MIDELETLSVLAETGTMTAAATRLRITQSAVSKRIASLEARLGRGLVEQVGRRAALTHFARDLIARTGPLLADLASELQAASGEGRSQLVLGVSESILASWGAAALAAARRELPQLDIRLNAHRSPVAIERVRTGEYHLALCAGISTRIPDLIVRRLLEEEMVILPSRGRAFALRAPMSVPVVTIESRSETWRTIARQVATLARQEGLRLEVTDEVQSFPAVVKLAQSGWGHGLVPRSLALALGARPQSLIGLPAPGLYRPIALVGRKRTLERKQVKEFLTHLQGHLPATAVR